jgi:arylsulfatase
MSTRPPFNGVIKLDVRDSKADWKPYELKRAPQGAPNVLIVLYDDTGQAAWSPFGGKINMPTLQKLADRASHIRSGIRRRCVLPRDRRS